MTTKDIVNVGLFGTNNGTISDLDLVVDLTVLGKNSNVGGLCGINTGMINHVRVSGMITADECTNVGGIVGYWVKGGSYSIIGLANHANISGASFAGGIAGRLQNEAATYNAQTLMLERLDNRGMIYGTGDCVGGLFGYGYSDSSSSKITVYSSTGRVFGNHPSYDLCGYLENIQLSQ